VPTVPRVLTLVAGLVLVGLVVARGIDGGREEPIEETPLWLQRLPVGERHLTAALSLREETDATEFWLCAEPSSPAACARVADGSPDGFDATLHAVEGGHSALLLVTGADRPFELAGATVVPSEVAPLHAAVVPVEGTPECVAFTVTDPRTGGLSDVTIHRTRVHRGGSGAESLEISESTSAACLPLVGAEGV